MANAARDLARLGASVLAAPLRVVGTTLHGRITGEQAVLELSVGGRPPSLIGRQRFLSRLRRAGEDERVAAVLLRLEGGLGGWAGTFDLRDVLRELSASGTRVYGLLESASNASLLLASACDRVFLVPSGEIAAVGVGGELTFFGGLLDRLGIQPDFEAAGAYKSFGEPFTRSFASAANREATQALIEDLHAQLVDAVADGRGIERAAVQAALNEAPLGADEALEAGLVDQLLYEDQVHAWIEDKYGEDVRRQSFAGWAKRDRFIERLEKAGSGGATIAVVHLQGPVVQGEGRGSNISARVVVPLIRALREDDEVASVVLHVSSPGGSALASDLIWREVDRLAEDKPVIASFEDVAASGGYYLAAPAREIVARTATLTGSIGVFGGKLVLGGALRQVGVTTESIASTQSATLFSASQPFTDAQRTRFRASLQRVYDGFVERVARGRGVAPDVVEPHCRGRVWTGRHAVERGLVDRFGTLAVGIERARTHASLGRGVRVVHVDARPQQPLWSRLISRAMPSGVRAAMGILDRSLGLRILADHQGEALALCPYELDSL